MSNARKVAVVAGPATVLMAASLFGVLVAKQDRSTVANWVAIASLAVAVIALIVTWLTWVRPMTPPAPTRTTSASEPPVNKVKGNKSFGTATNSRIVYGNNNQIGEGRKR